ncbi:glycosyltransferase family 2 protein [Candidatus Roizmanbacteria bacterium]|nr:glycosyltransferase family 2 protein [Candidatus Roizmanbacteria bacterium]
MNPISAIIVAKENPPHIIETIESIRDFVSEIIIADIGIDSALKMKLSSYSSVRFLNIQKQIPYVELIREDLKLQAKEKWVLFLDPDEVLTKELKQELSENIQSCDYFSIPRKNIIFGRWIQHSRWWPDVQVRLFKKDAVVWPTEIHKQPKVSGKEYKIEPKVEFAITHYNYESIDEYITKAMRYAKSEAYGYVQKKQTMTLSKTVTAAVSEFISRFFAGEGYKDGVHGFILAIFQMFYSLLVYFYFLEHSKFKGEMTEKELLQTPAELFGTLYKESLFWKKKKDSLSLKEKIIEKFIR